MQQAAWGTPAAKSCAKGGLPSPPLESSRIPKTLLVYSMAEKRFRDTFSSGCKLTVWIRTKVEDAQHIGVLPARGVTRLEFQRHRRRQLEGGRHAVERAALLQRRQQLRQDIRAVDLGVVLHVGGEVFQQTLFDVAVRRQAVEVDEVRYLPRGQRESQFVLSVVVVDILIFDVVDTVIEVFPVGLDDLLPQLIGHVQHSHRQHGLFQPRRDLLDDAGCRRAAETLVAGKLWRAGIGNAERRQKLDAALVKVHVGKAQEPRFLSRWKFRELRHHPCGTI